MKIKSFGVIGLQLLNFFITSAIGGSITYGQLNDPLTHFLNNLLF